MKIARNVALLATGAGAVLAYQRYSKPAMRKVEQSVNNALNKANNKIS